MSTGWTRQLCEERIKWSYKMLWVCHFTIIFSVIGMCICMRISHTIGGTFLWVIFGVAVAIFFGTLTFLWGAVIEIGKCKNILKELEKEEDEERVEQITDKLRKEVEELREEIRVSKLNPLELEEERWENNAKNINLSFFENLKKGEIIKLVSGSYYHPSTEISIVEFEYKHDFIGYSDKSEYGVTIHGFERYDYADEWSPTTMLATDKETLTSSCSGTVKVY